jgi:hypothetical protein
VASEVPSCLDELHKRRRVPPNTRTTDMIQHTFTGLQVCLRESASVCGDENPPEQTAAAILNRDGRVSTQGDGRNNHINRRALHRYKFSNSRSRRLHSLIGAGSKCHRTSTGGRETSKPGDSAWRQRWWG